MVVGRISPTYHEKGWVGLKNYHQMSHDGWVEYWKTNYSSDVHVWLIGVDHLPQCRFAWKKTL